MLCDSIRKQKQSLFKLVVEVGAVTHIQVASCQIDEKTLSQLRAMCVNEVRKINEVIRYEDAVKFQQSRRKK